MKDLKIVFVLGIVTSLIGAYLFQNILPTFGILFVQYPFQSFVVTALMVIIILLSFLTVKRFTTRTE